MTYVTRLATAALAVAVASAVPASAATGFGRTGAPDGKLRDGCHNYPYHYVVKAPTNDWILETFLVDPNGDTLSSGMFSSASDPRRGDARFRFCRYSTRAGTFTIKAKMHWYTRSAEHQRWFEPSKFRLRR